jgi:hypothetical protein
MSNQFDRISFNSQILKNKNIILKKGKEYTTQNNLLKLLFALFILTLCLAIYSIYSRIVINRKKRGIRSNK